MKPLEPPPPAHPGDSHGHSLCFAAATRRATVSLAAVAAFALAAAACAHAPAEAPAPDYWPTDGWRRDSPESRGMDSAHLAGLFDTLSAGGYLVDGVLIIKDGYIVADGYRAPYTGDQRHQLHSCTKSVVGACAGIAVADGLFTGVEATLPEIFPRTSAETWPAPKRSISLQNILTMSTGLDTRDSYLYRWEGLTAMQASSDWVEYTLARPAIHPPGAKFDYSNLSSLLLSAAIQQAAGRNTLEFASDRLFAPLGIADVYWPAGPGGVTHGWGNLRMHPEDLAKIGHLYLQRGLWDSVQVIPAAWVEESLTPHMHAGTLQESYGYHWWLDAEGSFMALGYRGQYLIVNPTHNLIVVFVSNLEDQDFDLPYKLYRRHILGSLESPLADRQPELERAISRFSQPSGTHQADSVPASRPPRGFERWSGTYQLSANVFGMTALTVQFGPDGLHDNRYVRHFDTHSEHYVLGPPESFALTRADRHFMAFRGGWSDDGSYTIFYTGVGEAWWTRLRMTFTGRSVLVAVSAAGGYTGQFIGKQL